MSAEDYFKLIEEAFNELKSNNIFNAKQIFDKALKVMPNSTLALYGKALCFYVEGQFDTALRLCEKALKIDKNSIPKDFYDDLLSKTDSKSNPHNDLDELLDIGLDLIYEGNFTQCNSFFDSILKSYPENPDATIGKAYSLYKFGNLQRAKALCRTIYNGFLSNEYNELYEEIMENEIPNNTQNDNSNNINSLLDNALSFIKKGLYESAETKFNEVLQLDSSNENAKVGIAYCFYKSRNFLKAYNLCSTVKPDNLNFNYIIFYNKIMTYYERKRNPSSKSNEENSLLNSALRSIEKRDYKTARNLFKKASKLYPKNPDIIVGHAYCFYKENRLSYSRTLCKKVDKFKLGYPFLSFYDEIMRTNANNNESNYDTPGKTEQSDNFQNTSNNSNVSELCRKGNHYLRNNNLKEAKKCFNKALKINPDEVDALMGNAKCFYHFGYDALALQECEKALKIDKSIAKNSFYLEVKEKVDNF